MLALNITPKAMIQPASGGYTTNQQPVISQVPVAQTASPVAPPYSLPASTPITSAPVIPGAPLSSVPQYGLIGSEQALSGGLTGGLNALNTGATTARSDLTGVMGGIDAIGTNYAESPAAQYQMQQMQRAVERSAAAKGGLLGGNTLRALQENAAGIAAQDTQNQFNRDTQKQQLKLGLAQSLADTAMGAGIQKAGLIAQTSGQVSQGRTTAGQQIAQNATQAAASISNLLNQQGVVLSDAQAKDISTITDMIYQSGVQDAMSSQNLASILANIAGGQASTVTNAYNNIGTANAAGTIGVSNALQQGIQMGIENYPKQETK